MRLGALLLAGGAVALAGSLWVEWASVGETGFTSYGPSINATVAVFDGGLDGWEALRGWDVALAALAALLVALAAGAATGRGRRAAAGRAAVLLCAAGLVLVATEGFDAVPVEFAADELGDGSEPVTSSAEPAAGPWVALAALAVASAGALLAAFRPRRRAPAARA